MKVYVPVWHNGVKDYKEIETEKARFFPSHSDYSAYIEYQGMIYSGKNVYKTYEGVVYYWNWKEYYNMEKDERIDPDTLEWSNRKPVETKTEEPEPKQTVTEEEPATEMKENAMKKTTQKNIKSYVSNGKAIDLTTENADTVREIARGSKKLLHSFGVCGINGILIEKDGTLYAITARNSNLFIVA